MDSSNEPPTKKSRKSKTFQYQWYSDHPDWKLWVKPCETDSNKFICAVCSVVLSCGRTEIKRHSTSKSHLKSMAASNVNREDILPTMTPLEASTTPSSCQESASTPTSPELSFNDQVKAAEVRFAKFLAENNIPMTMAPHILNLFKSIGEEPAVLQAMTMGATKATNVINKVVSVSESQRIVNILQTTKFSVFVDETSDITNDKWMTLMVRYVDPETLMVKNELLQLIHVDATDCSAEKLFKKFNDALEKKGIPIDQIIGLSSDNASVMVGKKNSFQVHMTKILPNLVTLPCICHSLALVAGKACSVIPEEVTRFIKGIPTFLNGSPKRAAIFKEFQRGFEDQPSKILRLAETRWLSRQKVVSRILDNWQALYSFLLDQSLEKVALADEWLDIMIKPMTKAYLIFLKFALDSFNKINANFQSHNTLVHRLQPASKEFLLKILRRFLKPALLTPELFDNPAWRVDLENVSNQLPVSEVDIGESCEKYLQAQQNLGVSEAEITQVRLDCLKFYVVAGKEVCKNLPFADKFLTDLAVFSKETALLDSQVESSVSRIENVCRILKVPHEKGINEEWRSLQCVDASLKEGWCKLSFDEMWMEICAFTNSDGTIRFPSLRCLLGMIRALPHSNAAAERAFSLIPDTKTKKRNNLTSETLNSICIIRSAAKSRNSASDLSNDLGCLQLMSSSNLYSKNVKPQSTKVNVYAYDSEDDWQKNEASKMA